MLWCSRRTKSVKTSAPSCDKARQPCQSFMLPPLQAALSHIGGGSRLASQQSSLRAEQSLRPIIALDH